MTTVETIPRTAWRTLAVTAPLVDLGLFRIRAFRQANLAALVFGTGFSAFFFGLVLFLSQVWGYSSVMAGLLVAPGPLLAAVTGVLGGRIADAHGHRAVLVPGALLFAAAAAWRLVAFGPDPDLLVWWPSVVLSGVGVGLTLPALSSAAVRDLPPTAFAVGSAVNQAIRQVGFVLGISLTVALLGGATGDASLSSLRGIALPRQGAGVATIGAMVTQAEIEHDPALTAAVPLLAEAAAVAADPLVRNRGTFGGALAEADPRADWPAVALALDATVRLRGPDGERVVPADEFLAGPGRTTRRPSEVLTAVEVPIGAQGTRSAYAKRTHPASGYALVGVAVVTDVIDGTIGACRVAVTGAGRRPLRALAAEATLGGERPPPPWRRPPRWPRMTSTSSPTRSPPPTTVRTSSAS